MLSSTLHRRNRHSFNIFLQPLPAIRRPIYQPFLITTPKRRMEVSIDGKTFVYCRMFSSFFIIESPKTKVLKYSSLQKTFNYSFLELSNALRGFPLDGCKFSVPEPFHGVVFQEMNRPLEENAERTFKVNGVFKDFTYWNYNKEPSENDQLKQALQWNDFANAVSLANLLLRGNNKTISSTIYLLFQLHKPITLEEFEKETTNTIKEEAE